MQLASLATAFLGRSVTLSGTHVRRRSSLCMLEDTMDARLKTMLSEKAIASAKLYWRDTRDDIYAEWLEKWQDRGKGEDIENYGGWDQHLFRMMTAKPVKAILQSAVMKDSDVVRQAKEAAETRPATLHPDAFLMQELTSDWDAEEEAMSKLELNNPPNLQLNKIEEVIEPLTIARRIMTIREDIAKEWVKDLAMMRAENDELFKVVDAVPTRRRKTDDGSPPLSSSQISTSSVPAPTDGSPLRAQNYIDLVGFITDLAIERIKRSLAKRNDSAATAWIDNFIIATSANAAAARASEAEATFQFGAGTSGGEGTQEHVEAGATVEAGGLKGNALLAAMMTWPVVEFDGAKVVRPERIFAAAMSARVEVASDVIDSLELVPSDHSLLNAALFERSFAKSATDEGDEPLTDQEKASEPL